MRKKRLERELNHPHFVGVRLSDIELELLDRKAEILGVSRSECLRKLLVEKEIVHRVEVVADMEELRRLVGAYGKIGVNLNQIARYNNLSEKSKQIAAKYSERILTTDKGKEFLLTTFPQIAAAYDLKTEELVKSIETDGYDFLEKTIEDLDKREKKNKILSWMCYISSFVFLVIMLIMATVFMVHFDEKKESIVSIIVIGVEIVILSAIIISIARFLFLLGKSLMVESIRNADRAHAIGLGRLYMQLYKKDFQWEELKDVLKNWNIDSGSAFINMDAKDIEAVKLDHVLSPFK